MFQKVSDERQMGADDEPGAPPQHRASASVSDNSICTENNSLPHILDTLAQINITEEHGEALI